MGLPFRITFDNKDHVYHVLNTDRIDHKTTLLELLLDGNKLIIERMTKIAGCKKMASPALPVLWSRWDDLYLYGCGCKVRFLFPGQYHKRWIIKSNKIDSDWLHLLKNSLNN